VARHAQTNDGHRRASQDLRVGASFTQENDAAVQGDDALEEHVRRALVRVQIGPDLRETTNIE